MTLENAPENGAAVTQDSADAVVTRASASLQAYCNRAGIDDSHGVGHALAVLRHAEAAIAAAVPPLAMPTRLSVRLAALLHDADDKKYSPATAKTYDNARAMMEDAGADAGVAANALRMISLVSCSANGNSMPRDALDRPELLWPRWADRLEATGEIGVVRCFQYNQHCGAPLSAEATPRPRTEAEIWELATEERFAAYQASGGGSASMMDHYYDKLLQIARPAPALVRNSYLEAEAAVRVAPLVAICLAYGGTGEVPVATIEAMASKLAEEQA